MTDMVRAAKWVRVSSGGQDEANQEPDIDRHCAGLGYNVVKTYTLHDKSASKGEQQAKLDEVIADMRANEIKVLVCWHSDRLERRGVLETLMFIAQIKNAGGRVESTQEGILDEKALPTIINAHMNHEKSAHLAQQVGLAFSRIKANGAAHGRAPWGMEVTGSKYEKKFTGTEEGRTWVPRIFGWVIEGISLAKISLRLQSEGIAGDNGPWHESTLGGMIRNPVYMGHRCAQDPKTKKYGAILSQCEALVDARAWRMANESLDKRPKRGYTDPDTRAMLSQVLKCGNPECDASGAPDSPMNRHRSSTRQYYRCCGTGAVRRSCRTMVPLELVDNAVDKIVDETFDIPRMVRKIIPGTDHTAELESLKFEMRKLPERELDWDAEDAEKARLRAEYTRIAALPVIPDREVLEDSGETYSQVWNALPASQRGEWLTSQGFTVRASKEAVTVSQGTTSLTISL
jgi:site-specific DNA recombinase